MPLADIVQETQWVIDYADEQGVVLRLFGGLAIRFHCPSATHDHEISDSDLQETINDAHLARFCAESWGALPGLTRHLAREVAKCGINVNAACPGSIDTLMVRTAASPKEI